MIGIAKSEVTQSNRGSQRMYHAGRTLQLAAMPVFLALAIIGYLQPSPLCTIPGPYGFLTSMWFMYLVMGAAHSAPWLPLAVKLLSKSPSAALPPLDCCAPPLAEPPARQDQRGQARLLA
jgi:hypothetical protein